MDDRWMNVLIKKKILVSKTSDYAVEDAVSSAINYASVIKRVKFSSSKNDLPKSLIIKEEQTGPRAAAFKELDIFNTEIIVYRDVITEMERLMEEYNDKQEKLWCHMYGYEFPTTVVLEDLVAQGFQVLEKQNALGLDDGKFAIKCLARFHALSIILLERGKITDNLVPPFYPVRDLKRINMMMLGCVKQLGIAISTKWPSKWKGIGQKICAQESVLIDKLKNLISSKKDDEKVLKVLNHGDVWICNLMFKHDSVSHKPTEMKFLDYQVCHIGSYMYDIIYFICTSIAPEMRRKHLNDFYKEYLQSLESNLKFYGYKKHIPTIEDIIEEAERLEFWAFLCIGIFYPALTAHFESGSNPEQVQNEATKGEFIKLNAIISQNFIETCGEDFEIFEKKGVF